MSLVIKVALTVLIYVVLGITSTVSEKIRQCFMGNEAEPTGNVTINCPQDHIISVEEVLFGRNKWAECILYKDDCVEKTNFPECNNLMTCNRSFKTYLVKCGYATVMIVSYTCLQVNSVVQIETTTLATTPTTITPATTTTEPEDLLLYKGLMTKKTEESDNSKTVVDSLNETGLIVGCVVAALITVIALVVAITIVIRRLLQKNSDEELDDDSIPYMSNICFDCSNCFTPKYKAHEQQLKPEEHTVSRQDYKPTSIRKDIISVGATEQYPDIRQVNVSIKSFTADGKLKIQQDEKLIQKLDSKASTKMTSSSTAQKTDNSEIKNCHKMTTDIVNCSLACRENVSRINEYGNNQSDQENRPKFDAVSIPNTAHGTIC